MELKNFVIGLLDEMEETCNDIVETFESDYELEYVNWEAVKGHLDKIKKILMDIKYDE